MRIELERLVYPEAGEEVRCAICERPFTLGLVIARILFWASMDGGEVCRSCATYLGAGPMGEARPDNFPTESDYERLGAEWRTPEYASAGEYDAAIRRQVERREASEARGGGN